MPCEREDMRDGTQPAASAAADSLPEWLRVLDEEPADKAEVPYLFMFAWSSVSAMALGSGALVGYRSFDGSVAYEALDKLEKSTPSSEAAASRMAVRAFAWGTALAVGSAAAAALAAWTLGVRSAADVGDFWRIRLAPIDDWLKTSGDWLHSRPEAHFGTFDSMAASLAEWWQSSSLGTEVRKRMDRAGNESAADCAINTDAPAE